MTLCYCCKDVIIFSRWPFCLMPDIHCDSISQLIWFIRNKREVSALPFHFSCFLHASIMFAFSIGWVVLKHLQGKIQSITTVIYSLLWYTSPLWIKSSITAFLIHSIGSNNSSCYSITHQWVPIFPKKCIIYMQTKSVYPMGWQPNRLICIAHILHCFQFPNSTYFCLCLATLLRHTDCKMEVHWCTLYCFFQ